MACVSRAPPQQFEQYADVKDKDKRANPLELLPSRFNKTRSCKTREGGGLHNFPFEARCAGDRAGCPVNEYTPCNSCLFC